MLEMLHCIWKFTRIIFEKRAKHIDFWGRGLYNINTHNTDIACGKLVTG